MRVITQLIQHFWNRRDLSTEQAAYLVDQGFIRAGDLEGFEMPPEIEIPLTTSRIVHPPNELELLESKLVSQAIAPKRGSGRSKGAVLTEKQLVAAIDAIFLERSDELEALSRLITDQSITRDWRQAITLLRKCNPMEFESAIVGGLRRRSITLRSLWAALDVEPFHAVIDKPNLHGRVARAFRLLLNGDQALPKPHTFLFKHAALKAARALAELHCKMLLALMGIFQRQPRLLSAALAQATHPVVLWAVTLIYNARRRPFAGPIRPKREYGPLPLPDKAVWRPAWSAALRMDPPQVTQLLVHCYADSEARDGRDPLACSFPFLSPRTW